MLLAEQFVLLALDTEGTVARGTTNQPNAALGVTGALIAELARDGHVDLAEGRIRLTGTIPTDPLLAQTLENLRPHEGKKLKSRLTAIKHSGWSEVVDAMVIAGVLGREKEPLHPTRNPVTDPVAHAALLAEVRAAATGDGPLRERDAVLLALAGPCQMLEVVAPDRADRKQAKRRIAHASEQVEATDAVKRAIDAVATATTAAVATNTAVYVG